MEEVNSDDDTNFDLNAKAVLPEKDESGNIINRIEIQAIKSNINKKDMTVGFIFTGPITSGKQTRLEFDISKLMFSDQITKKLNLVNELRKRRNPLVASKDDIPEFLKKAFEASPKELNSKNIYTSKIFITGFNFSLFDPNWKKLQRYKDKMNAMTQKLREMSKIVPESQTWKVTHLTFRETTVSTNFYIYCHCLTYDSYQYHYVFINN
jgi:uncharacterized coiled-coil protein SlyX